MIVSIYSYYPGCMCHRLWPGIWLSAMPSTIEDSGKTAQKDDQDLGKVREADGI
jgi:hypothetical protein